MKRLLTLLAGLVLLSGSPQPSLAFPAGADRSRAQLRVSATVTPWLEFSAQQHIRYYRVDAEDVSRGFVDLPGAMTLRVRSNLRHAIGFRILESNGQHIAVRESGGAFSPAATNLFMVNHTDPAASVSTSLDIRVLLSKNTAQGRYPLLTTLIPEPY